MPLPSRLEITKDVTIVVGNKHFLHSSSMLRYASKYFDDLFSSGDTGNEMRVDFPNERPSEWRQVSKFLEAGVAQPHIYTHNVHFLLPWFERLEMKSDSLKRACDNVYPNKFSRLVEKENSFRFRSFYSSKSEDIDECIRAFRLACLFDLHKTKRASIRSLRHRVGSRVTLTLMAGWNAEGILGEIELSRLFLNSLCKKDRLRSLYTANSVPSFAELVASDLANETRRRCDACNQDHAIGGSFGLEKFLEDLVSFFSKNGTAASLPKQDTGKDVTVIVGNQKSYHSSSVLCYASEYFDAMFSHDMKEKKEMKVEFPEDDPSEWIIVAKFLEAGIVQPKITCSNIHVLLPWFERLMMKSDSIKIACDGVFPGRFGWRKKNESFRFSKPEHLDECLHAIRLAYCFDLTQTKGATIRTLVERLGSRTTLLLLAGLNADGSFNEAELSTLFFDATCEKDRLRELYTEGFVPSIAALADLLGRCP